MLPASHSIGKAFRAYEPAIDLFPTDLWARVASRVLRRAPRSLYGHGNAAGYQPLRRAIAEYVGASRGVRCSWEQIIVTSGTQQALDLLVAFFSTLTIKSGWKTLAIPALFKHSAPQVRVSFQYL